MPDAFYILFFFALGACIGSFLNVIVWRVPRGESIVQPPSHCPQCNTKLAWYDNIPVFGWLALKGKCRYCGVSISARYPIIEALCGLLFVLVYVVLYMFHLGPCPPGMGLVDANIQNDWPIYLIDVTMLAGLLALSLIDAEHYFVPLEIAWFFGAVALVVHTITDVPRGYGALNASPLLGAMSAGAGIGLLISLVLLRKNILAQSFAEGAPLLEIDKKALAARGEAEPEPFTAAQVRTEIRKEMLFLMPPLLLGGLFLLLCWKVPPLASAWDRVMAYHWVSGFFGSLWGGLMGAFVVWLSRIVFSYVLGREAMGLGDVHLMLAVGAAVGAVGATVAFFLAPFVGLIFALYKFISKQGREVAYVPYLSVATLVVVLFYCPIFDYLAPGTEGIVMMLRHVLIGD